MKRAILFAAIALGLTIIIPSLVFNVPTYDYDVIEEYVKPTEEPTEEPATDVQEEALAYMNTDMDILTYINGQGWYYENYGSMTLFFNENSSQISSIAVSSYINPIDESARDAQTEIYIQVAKENMLNVVEDIVFVKVDDFKFGIYDGHKYDYTAKMISGGETVSGTYVYWWVDDRGYTSSMFSSSEDTEMFEQAINDIINNFQQPSKMN